LATGRSLCSVLMVAIEVVRRSFITVSCA
jgi:hypothetical protein